MSWRLWSCNRMDPAQAAVPRYLGEELGSSGSHTRLGGQCMPQGTPARLAVVAERAVAFQSQGPRPRAELKRGSVPQGYVFRSMNVFAGLWRQEPSIQTLQGTCEVLVKWTPVAGARPDITDEGVENREELQAETPRDFSCPELVHAISVASISSVTRRSAVMSRGVQISQTQVAEGKK